MFFFRDGPMDGNRENRRAGPKIGTDDRRSPAAGIVKSREVVANIAGDLRDGGV